MLHERKQQLQSLLLTITDELNINENGTEVVVTETVSACEQLQSKENNVKSKQNFF